MRLNLQLSAALILALAATGRGLAAEQTVVESARKVPVIAEVDVLVVGGSSGGVAAAIRAAESGAKVFLLASESYLGADLCATYRLWPESIDCGELALAKKLFAQSPPTPMHVKSTLAQALLDGRVEFLLESYPTDVLRDGQGTLAGVVIGNRSGRQAIVAKTIVDATPRAGGGEWQGPSSRPTPAAIASSLGSCWGA